MLAPGGKTVMVLEIEDSKPGGKPGGGDGKRNDIVDDDTVVALGDAGGGPGGRVPISLCTELEVESLGVIGSCPDVADPGDRV